MAERQVILYEAGDGNPDTIAFTTEDEPEIDVAWQAPDCPDEVFRELAEFAAQGQGRALLVYGPVDDEDDDH